MNRETEPGGCDSCFGSKMVNDNWKRMMFKGHKVWLSLDNEQQPIIRNNKVLIKYQLDQEHEYWVRPEAVAPIDPSHVKKKSAGKGRPRRAPARPAPNDLPDESSSNAISCLYRWGVVRQSRPSRHWGSSPLRLPGKGNIPAYWNRHQQCGRADGH